MGVSTYLLSRSPSPVVLQWTRIVRRSQQYRLHFLLTVSWMSKLTRSRRIRDRLLLVPSKICSSIWCCVPNRSEPYAGGESNFLWMSSNRPSPCRGDPLFPHTGHPGRRRVAFCKYPTIFFAAPTVLSSLRGSFFPPCGALITTPPLTLPARAWAQLDHGISAVGQS